MPPDAKRPGKSECQPFRPVKKLLPDHIAPLAPYEPGKPIEDVEREFGLTGSIKLASNENPLGPSPRAVEAMRAAAERVHRYPDGGGHYLRRALSERLGVAVEQLVLGAGSTDLIDLAARTFLAPGDNAVISENAFIMYRLSVQAANGAMKMVPMREHTHDVLAMARAADERTKILYIANPNNPTGTFVNRETLAAFFAAVPKDVVIVLDEAYRDYITDPSYPMDALSYLGKGYRLLALRTFSKSHGLAGLRVGYGISTPEVVNAINRVRSPFNVSSVAQAAALAALDDEEHVRKSRENNEAGKAFLAREFRRLGLEFLPTVANFFLVFTPCEGVKVFQDLQPLGVIVRPMGGWGYPNAVRVSIGTPEQNARLVGALEKVLPGRKEVRSA